MDTDVVVVGSGAGGGTAAAELARLGRRVLLIERGRPFADREAGRDERAMLIERRAADDRPIELSDGGRERLLSGGVPGGSTSLYGAALLRPSPLDFEPGRFYADRLPRPLHAWPIDYATLDPWYERAEDLFGVAGDHASPTPHLGRRRRPYPQGLPEAAPISRQLEAGFRRQGLEPFRLPLAIDFDRCLRCPQCPGTLCPTGARGSSWNRMVEPARATGLLEVWTGMEVEQLRLDAGRVRAVVLRDRRSGEHREVTAETVLVGAGAIGTPALLLRSGVKDESDQLGRNHMCHLGAVAVGVFARPTGAALHFTKELGLTDFYLGEPDGTAGGRGGTFRHKLGYAQAIPVPGPASLRDRVPFPVPDGVARWLHAHSLLFAGSVEDLPRTENRVRLGQGGRIRLQRAYHGYDVARGRWWARRLARTLRRAGAALGLGTVASRERVHVGHQVGTCRFGRDPRHAVLDPTCRVHSVDNLYVVDGSFMPTSLGVGPALTIAANALRVAHHVFEETS